MCIRDRFLCLGGVPRPFACAISARAPTPLAGSGRSRIRTSPPARRLMSRRVFGASAICLSSQMRQRSVSG
eukprot:13638900-Alexandrium_andersonii.AAC.1